MKKTAITLIVIGLLVVIGANLFVDTPPEPVPPPQRDDTTIRRTTTGEVVGFRDRFGARAWQGIPFAAAPVGDNRWRAPQTPAATDTMFEALAVGNLCPQFASTLSGAGEDSSPNAIAGEEDCLYLNVWSPPNAADLPVMFWIHGGGNTVGHGGSYSGAALATKRNVVVVTINYRLGLFGWFTHPALATGNPLDDSGNYGTLDAVRALEWVQENIGQFGGNPDNVTVFGESAGATDTLAMMASPLAAGLFHRAIVQSGGFNRNTMVEGRAYTDNGGHPNSSQELVAKMLITDGSVSDRAAAKVFQSDMNAQNLRDYLYAKPMEDFFVHFDSGGFGMINVPKIFRDGHVLPDSSIEEIFSNPENHNMVPTILGTNRDEPAIFMARNPAYVENWLGFLPRLKDEETYKRIVKYGALAWKERGVDSLANYMTTAGNPDVYAYRFDWDEEPSQAGFDLSVALGAAHGLEISFAFGDFEGGLGLDYIYPGNEAQMALAQSMTSYWSQFAYHGNPGQGRDDAEPQWVSWGTDGNRSIILDSPADQGISMNSTEVTVASIKQALAEDDGFTNPADQCAIYVRNFRGEHFSQTEYEALNGACSGLDPAQFTGF
jgi:para-nitrobenzyl esterase